MIVLEDLVEANADLMMADLEGEAVLLNIQSGRYFGLNEVGTKIWSMIKTPCEVSEIVGAMQQIFDAEEAQITEDVTVFLESMRARRLIQITSVVDA